MTVLLKGAGPPVVTVPGVVPPVHSWNRDSFSPEDMSSKPLHVDEDDRVSAIRNRLDMHYPGKQDFPWKKPIINICRFSINMVP